MLKNTLRNDFTVGEAKTMEDDPYLLGTLWDADYETVASGKMVVSGVVIGAGSYFRRINGKEDV